MDDALEAAELLADSGFEGAFVWLLRLVGVVALLAGLGLWLFTEAGLLVLPALLIVAGVALVALSGHLLEAAELIV